MSKSDSNFEKLENNLAKDHLEKIFKDFQNDISNEIERNRKNLFHDVKETLSNFTDKLEKNVSQEVERKISVLFEKSFQAVLKKVELSFEGLFSPVLRKTEENMKQLQRQGENTLHSWEKLIEQHASPWRKPFFAMLLSSVITGTTIFLALFFLKTTPLAYIFMDVRARKAYENDLKWLEVAERVRAEKKQSLEGQKKHKNKKKASGN